MTIFKLKLENLLAFVYIPFAIINTAKANSNMFLEALFLQAILIGGLFYSIRITRRTFLEEIKNGEYDFIIDAYKNFIRALKNTKQSFAYAFKNTKKRSYTIATKNDQVIRCLKNITSN